MQPLTTDEEFNQSYQKRTLVRDGVSFGRQAANDNITATNDNDLNGAQHDNQGTSRRFTSSSPAIGQVRAEYTQSTKSISNGVLARKSTKVKKEILKQKIRLINTGIHSWAQLVFWTAQVPLALISIAFFGISGTLKGYELAGGIVGTTVSILSGVISTTAEAVDAVVGTDFATIGDPTTIFLVTAWLVFIIGILTLMSIGLIYKLTLVNCLFGKGASLKIIAFIIAFFGYLVPVLNLLPWYMLWTAAVKYNPR
jgi:hypothetical protein